MKLKALDTIHVSSVKADSLRPGEEFNISDSAGRDLLKAHPKKFLQLDELKAKAEPPPKNKAEQATENKTQPPSVQVNQPKSKAKAKEAE